MKISIIAVSFYLIANCIHMLDASVDMKSVDLSNPRLVVTGSPYCERTKSEITFSRFSPELLERGEAELAFHPDRGRTATGTMLHFRSDAAEIGLDFSFGPGAKSGVGFAVYQNGKLTQEASFSTSLNSVELDIAVLNPGKETDYRIVLPCFANPVLTDMRMNEGARLMKTDVPTFQYVMMGDSISHKSGMRLGVYLSWPYMLAEELDAQLYNVAVGGSQISLAAAETLRDYPKIDLLTVLIGYNDCNAGTTPEAFKQRYIEALETIREKHPATPIVCISPTFTTRTKSARSDYTFDHFRETVGQVVAELKDRGDRNIYFCPGEEVTSISNLKPNRPNDKTHFSEAGAEMMTTTMLEWIRANIPDLTTND